MGSLVALSVLRGAGYLQVFEPGQLAAPARIGLGSFFSGYRVAMVFFGLGATLYAWLLLRSRFVPAALALFGIAACALVGISVLAGILFPRLAAGWSTVYFGLPRLVFEVALGVWLLLKGVPAGGSAAGATSTAPPAALRLG